MRSISRLAALPVTAAAVSACAPLAPYRTQAADATLDCKANEAGQAPAACQARVLERTASYDLMFVEFNDQGLQYPSERYGDAAAYQITNAMSRLRELASAHRGLSVVVFVHGWKHNASASDTNLSDFRKLLDSAALVEEATDSGYRVVGLYVSWRGLSNSVIGLRELSFWNPQERGAACCARVVAGSSWRAAGCAASAAKPCSRTGSTSPIPSSGTSRPTQQ